MFVQATGSSANKVRQGEEVEWVDNEEEGQKGMKRHTDIRLTRRGEEILSVFRTGHEFRVSITTSNGTFEMWRSTATNADHFLWMVIRVAVGGPGWRRQLGYLGEWKLLAWHFAKAECRRRGAERKVI